MNINEIAKNTKVVQRKAHTADDGGIVIESSQDVGGIIESNKAQFNSYDERAKWSDQLFGNKIASVPLVVIDDLNKKGIMRGFHVVDQARFKEWLNNPDNRAFRTRPGRV
jgi:hypothetical protein